MRTIETLRRSGVGIAPDRTILEAAVLMEQSGVGALAVVEDIELAVELVSEQGMTFVAVH